MPTALIRPLSGGAARGMMVSTMATFGPDSFASKLSGIFQGASDTTFYVVAVYFGAVNIKNTRYAIGAMLLADLGGSNNCNFCLLPVFWINILNLIPC
ncbi:MAG: hypothetical protein WDM90_10030 [Ferruginibacter sp.]